MRRDIGIDVGEVAGELGRGLVAGFMGTAVMTASSTLEMKLEDREPSRTPVEAAKKVFEIEPTSEKGLSRLSTATHLGYGTAWGAVRGLLSAAGLRGPLAGAVHLGLVWGAEMVILPALKVTSPPTKWGARALGSDLLHHLVYASVTDFVFELLEGPRYRRVHLPRGGGSAILRRPPSRARGLRALRR